MTGPVLVPILGDQLSPDISSLADRKPEDTVILMMEVAEETTYVRHHKAKIALILAAMRHFAGELREAGWTVDYIRLDDPENTGSFTSEVARAVERHKARGVQVTEPGEWRVRQAMEQWRSDLPVRLRILPDTRFVCPLPDLYEWAAGRKELRMEWFYREMRRKTGLLMEVGEPAGGQWNYDHDNRKRAEADLLRPRPLRFVPDEVTEEVLSLVQARFGAHFGALRPFQWAVTRADALKALDHFVTHHLRDFGETQDAMLARDQTLNHSLLSPYINIGLLSPLEVCERVEAAWKAGKVPINSAEGFIRQIIGWREYVRGIWALTGPDYLTRNALEQSADLPAAYWGGPTKMACLKAAVAQTAETAYAHHIQRLMVTGNFALLAGVDPEEVHRWYLAVYIDAFEWVEAPNTIGMSQFADGGMLGSKPYVSSGAYIDRMSDYCGGCAYKVKDKTGPRACPFNLLYWHFLDRHRARFEKNPRMAQMYRTWDKMAEAHRVTVLAEGTALLERLHRGAVV